ncbi:hypothetical protein J588_3062 [Acinetobacter sp. 1578804]|nr:hypothetical protein J588_3062 [Acinetobacter sp. 1578804]
MFEFALDLMFTGAVKGKLKSDEDSILETAQINPYRVNGYDF